MPLLTAVAHIQFMKKIKTIHLNGFDMDTNVSIQQTITNLWDQE
jgi:hypothetical protein